MPVTLQPQANGTIMLFSGQMTLVDSSGPATIPTTYTAPVSPGDPPGAGGGWWKIEYGTLGTGQDITTWQVNIRGNPVHLVIP